MRALHTRTHFNSPPVGQPLELARSPRRPPSSTIRGGGVTLSIVGPNHFVFSETWPIASPVIATTRFAILYAAQIRLSRGFFEHAARAHSEVPAALMGLHPILADAISMALTLP